MQKFLKIIGGKRGLSVIATAVLTVCVQAGWITPELARWIEAGAVAVGFGGIAHNWLK